MRFPDPRPGLVIRYEYLWKREAEAGHEVGLKDRPCAIVAAVETIDGRRVVVVLPVTHASPTERDAAIEIPRAIKAELGLDTDRSWIVISEANEFFWPSPDIRPIPGQDVSTMSYGMLPPRFFTHVRNAFIGRVRARRVARVSRTE